MNVSSRTRNRILAACLLAFAIVTSGWLGDSADAQEFRVYTKVYSLAQNPKNKPVVIARSLSLFQAGLVYDYILPAGEVVVFDMGNRRFTLLNKSTTLATVVTFDELEQLLRKSRTETERYLNQLKRANDQKSIAALRFQLDPKFSEQIDLKNLRLKLSSPTLGYDVTCASPKVPEAVATYLRYADWTARLNHILHPHAFLPGPRIALDRTLREKKWLPISVELRTSPGTPILRAEHQFDWTLDSRDRKLIDGWKKMLSDRRTRRVKFREYQRNLLSTAAKDR